MDFRVIGLRKYMRLDVCEEGKGNWLDECGNLVW